MTVTSLQTPRSAARQGEHRRPKRLLVFCYGERSWAVWDGRAFVCERCGKPKPVAW